MISGSFGTIVSLCDQSELSLGICGFLHFHAERGVAGITNRRRNIKYSSYHEEKLAKTH
jgi:hypothetical protein